MWAVIYWSGGTTNSSLIVYGSFSTLALAQSFIASRDFPNQYLLAQVFSPPPAIPPAVIAPVPFAAGATVVALATFGLTNQNEIFLYGTFGSFALAQAWIAGRPFPGGAAIRVVQAPPA
jgi:hypothetical protein